MNPSHLTQQHLDRLGWAAWAAALIAVSVVDLLTTARGLDLGGHEQSPLGAALLRAFGDHGIASLIAAKTVGVGVVLIAARLHRTGLVIAIGLTGLTIAACIGNMVAIAGAGG